jgi:hypothetical protein
VSVLPLLKCSGIWSILGDPIECKHLETDMTASSSADGRLRVYRKIRNLFVDLLGQDGGQRSDEQLEADGQIAEELCTDLMESIGLTVVSTDDDGSMLVRLQFDD